jgi:hypothetical protein
VESRIPVFLKQPPVRIAFTLRSHNEKASKRPSSLLELFGRNKVGAVPAKPMSVEPTRITDASCSAPSNVKSEHVKQFRTSDVVDDAGCGPAFVDRDVDTTGAVTSAHVGHRVCVSGTKVGQDSVQAVTLREGGPAVETVEL